MTKKKPVMWLSESTQDADWLKRVGKKKQHRATSGERKAALEKIREAVKALYG